MRHAQEVLELQNKLDELGLEAARLQKIVSSNLRTSSPLVKGISQANVKSLLAAN